MTTALAPASQLDLLDILAGASIKADREIMAFPFFCLTKKGRTTPLTYRDDKVKIEIKPGAAGMATIWDKDVLIYAASIINDKIERKAPVERKIVVPAYDILKVCQRGTGKRSYLLLMKALERLRATTILTDIAAAGERERCGFGWIDNYRVVERKDSRGGSVAVGIEIWLNEWLFRAIVKERRVLTMDPAYFMLTMGLERRLYELARKHCGHQQRWDIRLPRLLEKCGAANPLRNFKQDVKGIIQRDSLPGYQMQLMFDATSTLAQDIKADGYALPPRWGGNHQIVVRFSPKRGQTRPVDM